MAMRRVLIGVPCGTGWVHMHASYSINLAVAACIQAAIDVRALYIGHDAIVQSVRNDIVAAAVSVGFDDLVMVDADQDFTAEEFMRLLRHPVDVVGAPIRKKTDDMERYNVRSTGGSPSLVEAVVPGLLTSPDLSVGTGFIRFTATALKALWGSGEPYTAPDGTDRRWIFDVRPVNGVLVSEDTHVCDMLRRLGIPTYIDPTICPGHTGEKRWVSNFADWCRRSRAHLGAPPIPFLEPSVAAPSAVMASVPQGVGPKPAPEMT